MFAKVILHQLKPRAELLLRESQCGFRQGRGCADQLFSLLMMEKARKYHQPIYVCFIDLKKAYNSVHHDSLWCILQHSYQLPEKLLSIIQTLLEDSTAAVGAYGKISDKFQSHAVFVRAVCWPPLYSIYTLMWPSTWLWTNTEWKGKALRSPTCTMPISWETGRP